MTKSNYHILYAIVVFFIISCSKDSNTQDENQPDTIIPTVQFTIKGATSSIEPIPVNGEIELIIDAKDNDGIEKVEVFVNGNKVGEDISSPFEIKIDVSSHSLSDGQINNHVIKVVATDKSGNTANSTKLIKIENSQALISIQVPQGLFTGTIRDVFVFASDMDGNLLDSGLVSDVKRGITLYTTNEFAQDQEFMLTFMGCRFDLGCDYSFGSTFMNLKINQPETLVLKIPERFTSNGEELFETLALTPPEYLIQSTGIDYYSLFNRDAQNVTFSYKRGITSTNRSTDKIYIYNLNVENYNYSSLILDRPLQKDMVIDNADFSSENTVSKTISSINLTDYEDLNTTLFIHGYFNESDFENNIYHTLWSLNPAVDFPIDYRYDSSFHSYWHRLSIKDFYTEKFGIPRDSYTIPDWSINPEYTESNVELNITGTDHTVGKIQFFNMTPNSFDYWTFVFDSNKTSEIKIPELPEELKNSSIGRAMENGSLNLNMSELNTYNQIPTYQNYIQDIFVEDFDGYKFAPEVESIFQSRPFPNTYARIQDTFF